jgi:hypothetical protein
MASLGGHSNGYFCIDLFRTISAYYALVQQQLLSPNISKIKEHARV